MPLVVLIVGGGLSAWMYLLLQRDATQRDEAFFGERVAEAQAAIGRRMAHYVDALRGGASFFAASQPMNREQWRVYADSLQLQTRYPGINGLGVILAVEPDEIDAWKSLVNSSGHTGWQIRPFPNTAETSPDDVKYLITFVEGNIGSRAPIGRDIATEPSRRRAAELARDSGEPHIHQRIPGSRDTQRRSGLLLYVPLYRSDAPLETLAQRREAHLGWVYAQVFPDVFLDGVLGFLGEKLRLHFFESGGEFSRERLLYSSEPGGTGPLPPFQRVTEMTLAGEPFRLGWQHGPEFPFTETTSAKWVGASMMLATLLLAGLVTSLQSVGRRASAIAIARTAELAESEERFRHAFEFAGIGMGMVALDGRWLRVNRALCEIVGYPEENFLRKTFQDITHPDDLAADLSLFAELLEGRRRFYQLEKRYIHRDGRTVWVCLTASLVRDEHEAPLYTVSQIEDITERRRLEANLAVARDRALEDSRVKSEFLATMIHEIRTPINEVIGTTAGLRNTVLAPRQADYIRALELSGEALLTIIDDILDYTKIEAGDIELTAEPFDLRVCVDSALGVFVERARERGIKLDAVFSNRVPARVAGDPKRLRQILVNLLSNAIKFTESGEVRVNLTAEALDATTRRQRLKFAVRHSGTGDIERIFKTFSPVDPSTRSLGGTALGLSVSKRLAELMGGTMWAESEPGRGATFHFTILIEPLASPANAS